MAKYSDIEPLGAAMVLLEAWRDKAPEDRFYTVSRCRQLQKDAPPKPVWLVDVDLPFEDKIFSARAAVLGDAVESVLKQHRETENA